MARKLISGNDVVGFSTSTGTITVRGYVPTQKLLLVNNATLNTSIYNFSDPNTLATNTYNSVTNTTVIDLNYDTTSMSSSDKLQIFYESEDLEIKPARTYRDPVSKFRVSEPESLIDTDFEYGIQPTKWETLKLVNNIPTSYVSQDPNASIEVSSVFVTENSKIVTVNTVENHNLISGSIIEVVGLSDPQYEGTFVVKEKTSETSFTYRVSFEAPRSTNLSTIYSLVYSGSLYTGSSIEIADISTDDAESSTLTVDTTYTHGFKDNTKLFLKSSRASKIFNFSSPEDIVLQSSSVTIGSSISGSGGVLSEYYLNQKIITDDWIGHTEINVGGGAFNPVTGFISYDLNNQLGAAAQTALQTGDLVMIYTPVGNTPPSAGATTATFTPFYVYNVSTVGSVVSFQISTQYSASPTPFIINNIGTTTFGNHRIVKGSRVETITGSDIVTTTTAHGFSQGDTTIFSSVRSVTGTDNIVRSTSNGQSTNPFKIYNVIGINGTNSFTLDGNPNTSVPVTTTTRVRRRTTTVTTPAVDLNFTTGDIMGIFKVNLLSLRNAVYLPQTSGFSTTTFISNASILTYSIAGVGSTAIGGLVNGTDYLVSSITNQPDWYRVHPTSDNNLTNPINLTVSSGFATDLYSNTIHTFSRVIQERDRSSIIIFEPPRGGLGNLSPVTYSTFVSPISGLTGNESYYVRTEDLLLSFDQFRLSSTDKSLPVRALNYTANASTATIEFDAPNNSEVLGPNGIDGVGSVIQLSGFSGTELQKAFWDGLHTISSIGATANNIATINVDVDSGKNKTNTFSINKTNNAAALTNTSVCQIIPFTDAGGIGTHSLLQSADGIADDIYSINNTSPTSFDITTEFRIPSISKDFNPSAVSTGSTTSHIKIINHNFADGTAVVYNSLGTPIGGLTTNTTYYVRVRDGNFISLSETFSDALDRENGNTIEFSSSGIGTQQFATSSVKGLLKGPGTISFDTTSNKIIGVKTQCDFLSSFTNGDIFRIYELSSGGTEPGNYFESKIIDIKSNNILKLESNPSFASTESNYFIPTSFYAISDGKIVHRPFDGGVNISTGLIPNTQMIRQTRKYFRYQSGKGIQVSMAVNFNPTFDIDTITPVGVANTTIYNVKSKFPHQLSANSIGTNQKIKITNVEGPDSATLNRQEPFTVIGFGDNNPDFEFLIDVETPLDSPSNIGGFAQYNVVNWIDCSLKAGLFDDQNGMFLEYDGSTLYAVRRSSTQQISGVIKVERSSHSLTGTGTLFTKQLLPSDRIIIRGQTYKVVNVYSDTKIDIQPAYRGSNTENIVVSKVIDTKIPQSEWNLDRMDGTGISGYNIDINKIQMIYLDYSWYGAGTIRIGFKDTEGEVKYCHEFYHNNRFTESYMRSGNLPARYEVETFDNPLFSPSLFHWGASIIMDGKFDDDKAYLFTADSNVLPFTNGGQSADISGTISASNLFEITDIDSAEASRTAVGLEFTGSSVPSVIQSSTKISSVKIDTSVVSRSKFDANQRYTIITSKPALSAGNVTFNLFSGNALQLQDFIPLVSIRLSPSVDNGLIGNTGFRDIITRMQLTLKSASVLTTHDCEVKLLLNSQLSNDEFTSIGSPSLAQIYKHQVGDFYTAGTTIYSFRAQGGGILNSTTPPKRSFNVTTVELDELALLGNSILGGDGVFPDGPDILTIAVKPVDTSQITGGSPFIVSSRISWSEAQA